MGDILATACLLVFVGFQLLQGAGLNLLLCVHRNDSALGWFIADVILLLTWIYWLAKHQLKLARTEIARIPLPAAAFALYLLLCLIPRVSILATPQYTYSAQRRAGVGVGGGGEESTSRCAALARIVVPLLGWTARFSSNTVVTILAISLTVMLISLIMSGHAQHGLSSKYSLRYNTSSALFAVMDGVSLLQILFEAAYSPSGNSRGSWDGGNVFKSFTDYDDVGSGSGIDNITDAADAGDVTTTRTLNNSVTKATKYHQALNGSFGSFVLFIAMCSFCVPIFGLWQMKRESSKLKADEKLNKDAWERILRQVTSSSLQVPRREGMPSMRANPKLKSILKRGTTRMRTWRKRGKTMIRRMARKRAQQEKKVYQKVQRHIMLLDNLHSLWDFFLVNLPGFMIRVLAWTRYEKEVSVLIVKNMVSIFFRVLSFTVFYLQPLYRRMRGLHARQSADELEVSDLRKYAMATDTEAMPVPHVRYMTDLGTIAEQEETFGPASPSLSVGETRRHVGFAGPSDDVRHAAVFVYEPCEDFCDSSICDAPVIV